MVQLGREMFCSHVLQNTACWNGNACYTASPQGIKNSSGHSWQLEEKQFARWVVYVFTCIFSLITPCTPNETMHITEHNYAQDLASEGNSSADAKQSIGYPLNLQGASSRDEIWDGFPDDDMLPRGHPRLDIRDVFLDDDILEMILWTTGGTSSRMIFWHDFMDGTVPRRFFEQQEGFIDFYTPFSSQHGLVNFSMNYSEVLRCGKSTAQWFGYYQFFHNVTVPVPINLYSHSSRGDSGCACSLSYRYQRMMTD